jgi:hypothetical protein
MRVTDGSWLEANWERARIEGIAMMTFNPSIGRVLEPGGVERFKVLARHAVRGLGGIGDREAFDTYHKLLVLRLQGSIRTAKGKRMSYGQAQKAVNVFLKVYVDWAKLPNQRIAARLGRFLHVPLDSIVMDWVRREHPEKHKGILVPIYRRAQEWPSDLGLSIITYPMYRGWQQLFRIVRPGRPIDLDVIWSRAPR